MLRRSWLIALLALAGLALTGCAEGSQVVPVFQPRVPAQWKSLSAADVAAVKSAWNQLAPSDAISASITNLSAWSASENASIDDLFSNVAPQRPQAVFMTREIFTEELLQLQQNPEILEDTVLPLSTKIAGDGLEVRVNQVSGESNVYWLEQELAWDFSGITQTIRIVVAADAESELLSIFWVRCSDTCISENGKQIDGIFDSIQESR